MLKHTFSPLPNTAYALDAQQTLDEKGKTRVDLYAEQVLKQAKDLLKLGISLSGCRRLLFQGKIRVRCPCCGFTDCWKVKS